MRKVLYLTYDGITDPLGRSQILPYLLKLSSKNQFFIVSLEKPGYEESAARLEEEMQQHGIQWFPLSFRSTLRGISTFSNIKRMRKMARYVVKNHQPDLIHCRSYLPTLIALKIRKKSGIPFVFDMRGFWIDERVEGGLWNPQNPLYKKTYRYLKKKEKHFFSRSGYNIALTHAARDEVRKWKTGDTISPFEIIPTAVDTDLFDPGGINRDSIREKLGLGKDAFILTYIGSLGTRYELTPMLRFFRLLMESRPDSYFVFLTRYSKARILNEASRQQIDLARIKIWSAERENVRYFISASDFGIVFVRKGFSLKASFPTKVGEFLSMGIPVLTNDMGDLKEIFEGGDLGYVIDRFKDPDYKKIIGRIEKNNFDPGKIRSYTLENLSLQKLAVKYEQVYQQLVP